MADNNTDAKQKIKEMKKQIIKKGGVFAKLYFQVFGKSEEAVIDLAKGFSAAIIKAEGVKIGASEIAKPEKLEDGYYSTYIESYLVFESPSDLFAIVVDTTPFSIEVLEPEELTINSGKLTDILYTLSTFTFELKKKIFEANPKEAMLMKKMAVNRYELGKKLKERNKDGTSKN